MGFLTPGGLGLPEEENVDLREWRELYCFHPLCDLIYSRRRMTVRARHLLELIVF